MVDDEDEREDRLTSRQRAAIDVADAFLANPPEPAPPDARAEFGPDEIAELGCALALFIGLSKVLIVLGLEPDEMETASSPMPGSR